jgi:hypothetical protein
MGWKMHIPAFVRGEKMFRSRSAPLFAAAALVSFTSLASAATMRFDNGGGDGLWENALNWNEAVTPDTLPGANDVAEISNAYTVSLTSAQTIGELQMAAPNQAASNTSGTATLNIGSGANLSVGNGTVTNGVRIGRALKPGDLVGSSTGVVNQTAGAFTIAHGGSNGLRLSQADTGLVADSLYTISGGTLRGGTNPLNVTANLLLGSAANDWNRAEFRVVGSGATDIRFEDVILTPRTSGITGTGRSVLRFDLDSSGVTPITAEDELRLVSQAGSMLEVNLIGLAPESDIILVKADRLTNTLSPFTYTPFDSMNDGTQIVRSFGGTTYTWNLRYFEDDAGADDNDLDSYVKLEFVSAVVPEPTSLSLLALGALAATRRRRV